MARMRNEELNKILDHREGDRDRIKIFIETGTYRAERALMARWIFPTVYSIELSQELYRKAKGLYGEIMGLCLMEGDSSVVLPELLKMLGRDPWPICFFLDAHYFDQSGAESEIAHDNPMPLMDELQAIASRPPGDIVIVDDVHAMGREGIWSKIDPIHILESLGVIDEQEFKFIDDRLVIWR